MYNILVCDDEPDIVAALKIYLSSEGYATFEASNGRQALDILSRQEIHLLLLDVMMPELDGIATLAQLRQKYNLPVILLTAKSEDTDKVLGLNVGADDYVTKPFLPLELVARVKAQLRRYTRYNAGAKPEEDVIGLRGLVLNIKTHECTLNEKPLALTPTEFGILTILCRNPGSTVSSEALFHGVWGEEYYSKNNNTITVHIRHLREKMGDSFECPKYIKTVWGVGYKIEN